MKIEFINHACYIVDTGKSENIMRPMASWSGI